VGLGGKAPQSGHDYDMDVGLSKLPTPGEMSEILGREVRVDRMLTILTWGDALTSKAAVRQKGAQIHINAKPLSGRGGGADLKHNALQDAKIVRNVVTSMNAGVGLRWLHSVVRRIEEGDLSCVSVFCSKGRHRSVSSAEVIRSVYYPQATIVHLTIR